MTCDSGRSGGAYGQGNYNLSVADVDADGRDEIAYGSATIDDNGALMHSTSLGQGDAMHVSDLVPSRPGLEVFDVHEWTSPPAMDVHDARCSTSSATGARRSSGAPPTTGRCGSTPPPTRRASTAPR